MSRAPALLALGASLGVATGCRDSLERFDTGPDEAYCGSIVGKPVRDEFPVPLRLRATIDTDNLTTIPGKLSTDDAAVDPKYNPCVPSPRLKDSPMRATDALLHDQLSSFEFGTGRDHNFFAWVESCEGPYLAVVSLMRNVDVEVRLMKPPAPPADGGSAPTPPGFALFQLERQKGDCGF